MQRRHRVKGFPLWPLLGLLFFIVFPIHSARADCGSELAALKAKLPTVVNAKRREEAKLLIDKAAIEQKHERTSLCEVALEQASKLMN